MGSTTARPSFLPRNDRIHVGGADFQIVHTLGEVRLVRSQIGQRGNASAVANPVSGRETGWGWDSHYIDPHRVGARQRTVGAKLRVPESWNVVLQAPNHRSRQMRIHSRSRRSRPGRHTEFGVSKTRGVREFHVQVDAVRLGGLGIGTCEYILLVAAISAEHRIPGHEETGSVGRFGHEGTPGSCRHPENRSSPLAAAKTVDAWPRRHGSSHSRPRPWPHHNSWSCRHCEPAAHPR